MKIYTKDTEINFLNNMKAVELDKQNYRAAFIKLSLLKKFEVNDIRELIEKFEATFVNYSLEPSLYLFSDRDIVITYKGISSALVDKLSEIIGDTTGEDPTKILSVFDLEKNFNIAKNIGNKKLELIKLEEKVIEASKVENEVENKSYKLEDIKIDEELLHSLIERKNSSTKPKILVVEDDAFSRVLVRNVLQKDNYEVIEAETGLDAIKKYITYAPNIVFLDINLPDSSGIEVLEQMMKMDKNSFIVMLSGNAFKDNIVVSIEKGAKGFVGKPFPKSKIEQYILKYKADQEELSNGAIN